jgi:hypothetical protein
LFQREARHAAPAGWVRERIGKLMTRRIFQDSNLRPTRNMP